MLFRSGILRVMGLIAFDISLLLFKVLLSLTSRIARMKLSATAVLLLLPASILAVPAAESSNEQCHVVALSAIRCKVANITPGTTANCRTGPGTDYPVAKKVDAGSEHLFSCYKKGECVDGNW